MKKRYKKFDTIAKEFLENDKFMRIQNENHHGITRYEHSMRVARNVYKLSKKLNLDYISATRAAIVHDFFVNEEFKNKVKSATIKNDVFGSDHCPVTLELDL